MEQQISKQEQGKVGKTPVTKQETEVTLDDGYKYNAAEVEASSDVSLKDDKGEGAAAIIRTFYFKANPEAFKVHKPSKQQLFNAHAKGIEVLLWQDGLKVMPEVTPKVSINKKKTGYRIIVGAEPARGQLLYEKPSKLTELINGRA